MKSVLAALVGLLCVAGNVDAAREAPVAAPPAVEVVFVLDTTGSMGGLIAGAKEKIWFIANQILAGNPRPTVRMGLVAYRDKNDDYVTKVFDLTDNMDQVYTDLMKFQAQGGGDTPENVNQALHDAVHKVNWATDATTLRIIYLVGDAPPHPYQDVPGYAATAEIAVKKNIIINTIQCGGMPQTTVVWKEIASLSEGVYLAIDQAGGVQRIATPYDAEMSTLNARLMETTIVYGDRQVQATQAKLNEGASSYAAPAAAERASFAAKSRSAAGNDLLDTLRRDNLKLADVDHAKLPEDLRNMSEEERAKHVAEKQAAREQVMKQITELTEKRDAFIRQKLTENEAAPKGFDVQVIDAIKKQAGAKGIRYE